MTKIIDFASARADREWLLQRTEQPVYPFAAEAAREDGRRARERYGPIA